MAISPPRAWAEIDLDALRHNFRFAQAQSGGQEVMAVVKANAYGHGVREVIKALEPLQPSFYGVANVFEAREVRALLPEARIYLLGVANPSEYEELVAHDYTPCASSMAELHTFGELAARYQKTLRIHLAIDTGMGRGGFLPDTAELEEALAYQHSHLEIEGIGSHLPVADEDPTFTEQQFQRFASISKPDLRYRHLANSAGLLHYADYGLNLVRPGLMLYGVSPLPEYQAQLKPVMRLCSRISLIRDIPAGHGISYGRTFITQRDSRIATIGIGYADGYHRSLSGRGAQVSLRGVTAPVIGRVTMDQIMVDVTDVPECYAGDIVELFGTEISVSTLAQQAGTIPWELFTGIAPRVQRIVQTTDRA